MAFVTFAERYGIQKGRLLGSLETALEMRFGEAGKALAARFAQAEVAVLEKAAEAAKTATLEEVQALLPA